MRDASTDSDLALFALRSGRPFGERVAQKLGVGLAEHAERVIREPVWARGIAEAGRRRALAEHTLVHRMREVEVLWA